MIELEAKEIREFKEYKEISELLIIFPNLPKFPKRDFSFNSTNSQEKSRFCDFFLNFKVLFQILCRIGLYLAIEKHIV